jgi:hypothetical protein
LSMICLNSPCLLLKDTFWRENSHTTYGALFEWNEWMIQC